MWSGGRTCFATVSGSWTPVLGKGARLTSDELELAQAMRESIRELLEAGEADLTPLREVAEGCRPHLTVGDGGKLAFEAPEPACVQDALFQLLLIIRAAQEDGTWSRLRVCANDECRWAFYDRSKNQQGSWCDMAVCGNRLKNREFRARRRGYDPAPPAPALPAVASSVEKLEHPEQEAAPELPVREVVELLLHEEAGEDDRLRVRVLADPRGPWRTPIPDSFQPPIGASSAE